jgi:predicted ribosome quality control (RQC) complex YloA/Tae2 family protein
MKQRYTFLDLRATVNELRPRLVGKFIQNFYTASQRILYIKFSNKDILLVEAGTRMHLTGEHDDGISHFCKILRRRARREKIVDIYQVGFDRIVVIEMTRQRLVLEFFSGGNMLILEGSKIVEIFRTVKELNIAKEAEYVFNYVDFDLSFEGFVENDLENFLPFDELLVEKTKRELAQVLKVGDVMDIKKAVESGIPVKESVKEGFNGVMRRFKGEIEMIQGHGSVLMKKGQPFNLLPFKAEGAREFPSFNEAADFFFSSRRPGSKNTKESKADRIRKRQEQYMQEMEEQGAACERKAAVLEENAELAEKILKVLQNVVKNRMKWNDFEKFREQENRRGNEISQAIVGVDFAASKCVVKLGGEEMELDFGASLFNNISIYFQKRKKMEEKIQKTKNALEDVLRKVAPKAETRKISRSLYWFEKFNFFFSSDNALVIGGKDAQQNDIVVKKHLGSHDLYFHGDVQGCSSIVVKKPTPKTISEAASMALCMSKCWEDNVVCPVWYVMGDQVSKTAPSGEYLPRGSFMVRGKKTYVECHRIEYGLGLLFKVEEDPDELEGANTGKDELAGEIESMKIADEEYRFVGDPAGREIVHAMPVCGPWPVVSKYKYKLRLLPGREKKGKLVQEISRRFIQIAPAGEKSYVLSITPEEYMSVLFGGIRIPKQ